jgi:hypothetical protein
MASKKKTSSPIALAGYIPANYTPDLNAKEILLIPPYDDAGISFKGYSKKNVGGGNYQLTPQVRRIQRAFIVGAVATTTTITRVEPDKRFYAASMHVSCNSSGTTPIYISIYDGNSASSALKAIVLITQTSNQFDFDFLNSPREFLSPNIFVSLGSAMTGANDVVDIQLIGWSE